MDIESKIESIKTKSVNSKNKIHCNRKIINPQLL